MKTEICGWFPTELSRLLDEALQRQVNRRESVEAWAQLRKDREVAAVALRTIDEQVVKP